MSRVLFAVRRGLMLMVVAGLGSLLAPALASAAQSFSITAPGGGSSFPANGNVPYTTTMNFDTGAGSPQRALITTSPGVLAALSANPSCIRTRQITAACQIGTGTATLTGLAPASLTAYLVPPTAPATDVAGIDLIATGGSTTHAEIQLKQNAAGNVSAVLNVDFSGAGAVGGLITGSSLTVNSKLNGKPFTRMPSNCSPGPSSLTVQYSSGKSETTGASPDFHITGCSALPYSPHFSAAITKDTGDEGVKIVTTVTQASDEAASASNALRLPFPAVGENLSSLSIQCATAPCGTPAGSVVAASPLLPTPLSGLAYLTGTPLAPTLTLLFPPPNALELVGTVNLSTATVTFNGVPDVPQTSLVVTLNGGPHALEIATCSPPDGTASGSFTGQNGKAVNVSEHVTVLGCPPPVHQPKILRASLSGLSSGKPVLGFTLTSSGGPKLRSFTVSLPQGLKFNPHGLRRGLSVRGAKSSTIHGSKLTVTLRPPANTITARLRAPLLVAGKHRRKHILLLIRVTNVAGRSTSLTARL